MTQQAKTLTELEAADSIDLLPGEQILHVTGRHIVLLIQRMVGPLAIILSCIALVIYRSIGGTFISVQNGLGVGMDSFNRLLLLALGLVVGLFALARWRLPKARAPQWTLVGLGLFILLWIFARTQGVSFFSINRFEPRPFDLVNILLVGVVLLSLVYAIYVFFDWSNDELVLTNKRVIYDNDTVIIPRLLENRVQRQIPIEDIQGVSASTSTYLQHWFNYGKIDIKTAGERSGINFAAAADAKVMQAKINDQVKRMQAQRSADSLRAIMHTRVYDGKPEKPKRTIKIRVTHGLFGMRWLLAKNPEIDEDKGEVVWRAHWLFLLMNLLKPMALLFAGWVLLAFGLMTSFIQMGVLVLVGLAVLLVALAWGWWEVEDHKNDLYIITPNGVRDVYKKPFGPEDVNSAGLDKIQNVTFETTFISNFLGYGDVFLKTAGTGKDFTFERVPHPREVVATINDYLAEYKRGERERSLNDTLALLRFYYEDWQIQQSQQRNDEV